MAELIRDVKASGVAVLLSSHRLDEIEAVSDRIVVLVGGMVRFDGTAAELAGSARFAEAMHAILVDDPTVSPRLDR